jgi:hypothetical protein
MPTGDERSVLREDEVHQYESPRLVLIGNLHTLLAGGGTQNCDAGALDPSNGSDNACL